MDKNVIPEAFHAGEYIRDELEERDWTQADLADILGYPPSIVSDIITGRRFISPEFAAALGEAFNTGAQVWLNVQAAYQLAQESGNDDAIKRRAMLYDKAPIREMVRRGWIQETSSVEVLETQVCRFFEIESIDDDVELRHAARKSTDYCKASTVQLAWLARARHMARNLDVEAAYNEDEFDSLMDELSRLLADPFDTQHVPPVLARYGIRFLVLEHLPKTKIDGACFWLDNDSPVVVLSVRYDRIDGFWYSLYHELGHIMNRDGLECPLVETDMLGAAAQPAGGKRSEEVAADEFAASHLVDPHELEEFVDRCDPLFSRKVIVGFAGRMGVHPGIVVGQLQFRGKIPYANLRATLVKVRDIVTSSALTDGWGRNVSL